MIPYNPYIKRLVDIIFSLLGLILFFPFLFIIGILIRIESKGGMFFVQERIGKDMRPFRLIKFRSMMVANHGVDHQFEPGANYRITKIGKILRDTKIDELPELFNILMGDMSIVGPRPEVPKYIQNSPDEFAAILHIRPGLSDYASIKYRNEEEILASEEDPDGYYRCVILPDKLRLAKRYVERISFKTDMAIIIATLRCIIINKALKE